MAKRKKRGVHREGKDLATIKSYSRWSNNCSYGAYDQLKKSEKVDQNRLRFWTRIKTQLLPIEKVRYTIKH